MTSLPASRSWRPTTPSGVGFDPFEGFEPDPNDEYWVIDDLDAGDVHIVRALWPGVNDDGHLVFGVFPYADDDGEEGMEQTLVMSAGELHALATQHRARHRQEAAHRPLRVGDVFWFRGRVLKSTVDADDLMDITYSARQEAKASQRRAIARTSPTTQRSTVVEPPADELQEPPVPAKRPSLPGATAVPSV